jgi:hypothetical protein
MKKCVPCYESVYLIVFALLFYVSAASAQNEGIGTFSDLVGEALHNPPQPQPTPVIIMERTLTGEMQAVSVPPPFFSAPSFGLEYDYRRNQQKTPNGLTIDVNEAHSSFSFVLALARATRNTISWVSV